MLVAEIIHDLHKRFPRSPIDAWESSYRAALDRFSSDALGVAYRETMRQWSEPGPPKPVHIAAAVRIPKVEAGKKQRQPWEIEDDKRRARAKEIFETACRECAEEFRIGDAEGWSGSLRIHLIRVSDEIARIDLPVMDALTKVNGQERRGKFVPRAPEVWIDEIDIGIFRARLLSQRHVAVGRFERS